ncbi:ABC transporter substrate-binding protein [Desulfomarina profundi]|uniref:ABC transporter substrate-binding protein n=1 Tax=Desulfomarina profundi TaxID=2772557 RepID=A0A8D5JKG1_9BACT|nr:ABC transporter substrate-binding protein [Desulfomarina profundi]BCL59512.1 ABC transporter substrate-binding protein [Desulfomarina profundi]
MRRQLCFATAFFVSVFILFFLVSCENQRESIKLGLAINLSGRGGAAGEHIRNGALLAVEEINEQGGINGHSLELLIRDDKNTSEGIRQADRFLLDRKVVAVIGHSTSRNTLIAYPAVTSSKTLLITPYAATNRLTGKDDLFVRTQVSCDLYGKKAAELFKRNSVKSVALLMDLSNSEFVMDWAASLKRSFSGKITEVHFNSSEEPDWEHICNELLSSGPDAVLFLAEAGMTGIALQKIKAAGFKGRLFSSVWAHTPELFRYSGQAAEGLSLITFIDPDNSRPRYLDFSSKMKKIFKTAANPRSTRAYELIYILADGLRRCSEITGVELKKALLAGEYDTLMGHVQFDKYGDVLRPVYEVVVRGGQFHNNGEI